MEHVYLLHIVYLYDDLEGRIYQVDKITFCSQYSPNLVLTVVGNRHSVLLKESEINTNILSSTVMYCRTAGYIN